MTIKKKRKRQVSQNNSIGATSPLDSLFRAFTMMGYDVTEKLEEYKSNAAEECKGWGARGRLINRLTDDAQAAHKTGRYETSLDKFVHLLALIETDPSTTKVSETRATITSNIGSALHFLGETELAQEFYERALKEFGDSRTSWMTWLYMGDLNSKRTMYIQARLAMLAAGERPDPSSYQDGFGKSRQWTKEEMEGTDKSWSIFQPRTWWYGGYVPAGGYAQADASSSAI